MGKFDNCKIQKLLFINCTDVGSTGKIIQCITKCTNEFDIENILVVPRSFQSKPMSISKVYAVSSKNRQRFVYYFSKLNGNRYGQSFISTNKVISILNREKPDVVHVHCANGSFLNLYRLFTYLGKNHIPTVITNHAEFYYTGNCDHAYYCDRWKHGCGKCPNPNALFDCTSYWWKKMKIAIQSMKYLTVTSVSNWVFNRSKSSPIMYGTHQVVVENAVDTTLFHIYTENDIEQKFPEFNTSNKILLYVTAFFYGNSEKKGSKYLLQLAERLNNSDITIIVAGSFQEGLVVPDNVKLLGRVNSQLDLAKMYHKACLTCITSERETFSMPVAESLCCGTPIVGFKAGGPESVALNEYSEFVPYGNVEALERAVKNWIDYKTDSTSLNISLVAKNQYSDIKMGHEYLRVYEDLYRSKLDD